MSEKVSKGTLVEIHRIVLNPEERAPQVPEDTKQVPLELRVKGFLTKDSTVGEEAEIITLAGRKLTGSLVAVSPEYTHKFGAPIGELTQVGREVREILEKRKKQSHDKT